MPSVFYIGDHPAVTTGFGTVAYHVTRGLHELGWNVRVFGALAEEGTVPDRLFPFPVQAMPLGRPYGEDVLPDALHAARPDVVLINNEFRTAGTYAAIARETLGPGVPIVAYRGIAVRRMPPGDVTLLGRVDRNIAYTRFARRAIRELTGEECPVVYHGLDHDRFTPLPAKEREAVRRRLGWSGRFVVLYISRNRPNKKQHRIMKALVGLRDQGVGDVLAHFHCRPVVTETFKIPGGGELPGGFDLPAVARQLGAEDLVSFPSDLSDETRGDHPVFGRWNGDRYVEPDISFRQLYGAADLYLHPSDLETFGLPLVEAMACGTPAAHPDSCGVRCEVCGDAAYRISTVRVRAFPEGWEVQKMTPGSIGEAILHFRQMRDSGEDELRRWRQRGVEWVKRYDWRQTAGEIAAILRDIIA